MVRPLRECARPGCGRMFLPHRDDQKFCSVACSKAHRLGAPAPSPEEAAEHDPAGSLFWHRVLDVCHHARLGALPMFARGCASITKDGWLRLFKLKRSRLKDPDRYFERFKEKAREHGLERDGCRAPGEDDDGRPLFHLDIEACYEAAFRALGGPHPGGPDAADRATRRELAGRLAWILSELAARRGGAERNAPRRATLPPRRKE